MSVIPCVSCDEANYPLEGLFKQAILCDDDGNKYIQVYVSPDTPVPVLGFTTIGGAIAQQSPTGAWADFGAEIEASRYNSVSLFVNIAMHNTANLRFRLVGHSIAGDTVDYLLPIKTITSSVVTVLPEYYELDSDTNQALVLSWDIDAVLPYIQFQMQAGTPGGSPADVDGYYVLGYK